MQQSDGRQCLERGINHPGGKSNDISTSYSQLLVQASIEIDVFCFPTFAFT